MQVFVVDNKNRPLMPCRPRKAKKLLKKDFASVKLLITFTICLKNASSRYTQDISFKKNINGFQLFDKVKYENMEVFIYGRRESGYFKISYLDGTTIHNSVNYKKLTLLEKSKTLLINKKRSGISFPCLKTVVCMPSFR